MTNQLTNRPDASVDRRGESAGSTSTEATSDDQAPQFVDSHAHLDETAFDRDRVEVIRRSVEAGVSRIVNIGFCPARWESTAELVRRAPGIHAVLGLHPQSAAEYDDRTCHRLAEAIELVGARAVGEIGLDYYRDQTPATAEVQRRAFAAQLDLAHNLGLPVVIHQRAAAHDCWDMLRKAPPDLPILLHCFEGDPSMLRLALERGYLLGIGGLLTRSASDGLRAAVRSMPIQQLVLETDAPYLTPAGVKDRRNTPANIPLIAHRLAEVLDVPLASIARQTTANAIHFFGAMSPLLSLSVDAADAAFATVR